MKKVILLSVSILLIFSAYSFAEVPCKINYQGRLIKDNVPVDGTKKMVFSIYNDAVAVTPPLWTSGEVDVTVHNGLFRYVLDLSSIDDWTAGETLYLEVQVGLDILTPREELYAYPYAINSHLLEGATKGYFINTSTETQKKDGGLNIMGNVGIGTTGPGEKFTVDAGLTWTVAQFISDGSKARIKLTDMSDDYYLVGSSNKMSLGLTDGLSSQNLNIDSQGNVGIGTTSPTTDANPNGDTTGNLDVNDVWLRGANAGAGGWASEGGGWVFDETSYPNRSIPETSWYNLDLSAKVGNKRTLVLLKVKGPGSKGVGFNRGIIAKPYNDPDDFAADWGGVALNQTHLGAHGYYKLIMITTDNNGRIGLRSTAYGTVQWDIKLVGYIKK